MLIGAIIVVTLFALLFDRIVAARHRDSLWNWRSAFLSTLMSVVLGLAVGLKLYEFGQKSAAVSERARYLRLLGTELSSIQDILSDAGGSYVSVAGKKYPLLITHLEPVALEDAARSGLFGDSETENLLRLSRILHVINIEGQVALTLATTARLDDPAVGSRLKIASENLERARTAGLESAVTIMKELQTDYRKTPRVRALEIFRP